MPNTNAIGHKIGLKKFLNSIQKSNTQRKLLFLENDLIFAEFSFRFRPWHFAGGEVAVKGVYFRIGVFRGIPRTFTGLWLNDAPTF